MTTENKLLHDSISVNIDPAKQMKQRAKGFTLLELLVALGIVSISFMAILPLLWNTMSVNSSMKVAAKAKDVAVQKVEELMSLPRDVYDATPYNMLTNASYTSPAEYITDAGVVTTATDPAARYTRTFNISQVPGVTQDPKPVVLTSVVQYTFKGQTQSRSFSTMWSF